MSLSGRRVERCPSCHGPKAVGRVVCYECASPAPEGWTPTTEWGKARQAQRDELRKLGAPARVIRAAMRGSKVIHS